VRDFRVNLFCVFLICGKDDDGKIYIYNKDGMKLDEKLQVTSSRN